MEQERRMIDVSLSMEQLCDKIVSGTGFVNMTNPLTCHDHQSSQ